MLAPCRAEVWSVDFGKTAGHEQAFIRPALVVSDDIFNHGPAQLAVVLPLTTRDKGIPYHVAVSPPEGGLKRPSFIMAEQVRCVTTDRFRSLCGSLHPATMKRVESALKLILSLDN
jgi:mRNA interferase MazF